MNIPEVVEGWVFFITKLSFPQDSDSTGADSNHAKTMAGSGKKHSGHHGDEDGANGKNGKGKKGSEDGEAAGEEGEDAGGKIRVEIFRSGTGILFCFWDDTHYYFIVTCNYFRYMNRNCSWFVTHRLKIIDMCTLPKSSICGSPNWRQSISHFLQRLRHVQNTVVSLSRNSYFMSGPGKVLLWKSALFQYSTFVCGTENIPKTIFALWTFNLKHELWMYVIVLSFQSFGVLRCSCIFVLRYIIIYICMIYLWNTYLYCLMHGMAWKHISYLERSKKVKGPLVV